MAGFLGRLRSLLSARTVARQVFVLQAAIVVLLVVAAVVALVLQVRTDTKREAGNRSLAVAQSFAKAPGIEEALSSPDPSAVLQPRAEAARKATDVDFIVVMTTDGIRYTHPNPDRIGKHFVGTIAPAAAGGIVRETYTGTLGPSVRAVVPVADDNGKVIALVAAGVTLDSVGGVVEHQLPTLLGSAAAALALATAGTALVSRRLLRQTHGLGPEEMTRMYEHHDAVLHSVREGVLIMDDRRRLALANDEARRLLGLTADAEGRPCVSLGIGNDLARLFASGRDATDEVHLAQGRLLAVSQRSTDRDGGPPGSVATLRDTTELRTLTGRADVAQERLKLLYDAGLEIGTTLDVTRTSQELTDFAVPRFADFVSVDLADPVLRGEEPKEGRADMRRVAFRGVRDDSPLYPIGKLIHFAPGTPQAFGFGTGRSVLETDLPAFAGWQEQDPANARRLVRYGFHAMLTVPLRARGVIMGMATFWRADRPDPFESEDVSLAEELVARAAVSIDNARRYTREHTLSVTLQRSLLPRALPGQSALDVAYRYLPAQAAQGGVGGDWFDVIPLPGARVALVVGDVVGHGLHAAATMGRLRTAVHNFSTLDLPPDELLGHLDELVNRIDQDEGEGEEEVAPITGATCLYAVYDPSTGLCALARAGHLEPALVHPDGRVEFLAVPGGAPLGLGGSLPFEATEVRLSEGSGLVLYTDGLVEDQGRDIDEGLERLRDALAATPPTQGRGPEETCKAVLETMLPERPRDDVALVVARTRLLPSDRTASWDVPDEASAVARVRAAAARTLEKWGLEEEAFTTELILSELVTNALRHATGPIRVRLIRDLTLICEVSDGSSTAPHLRSAATTDEGGRGLFLVAQFADRWGTRYTADGKVIWTEQPLPQGR
ncbi:MULTISPECIES: SpoIIE family protein phosphatase/ATP-binding protein [Streptomyces]|uniref:SpoIIE family protein phosphatase/ATP-binding protein n=1 Tax=Streptomyces TaxID=1883 RepID=UPI00089D85CF|nr:MULTISPECIES: SpoIIE family protein phosphatase/ATP-binding protein [unclassified Streptomyces]SEB94986.1 PAS domain-containing protein [Streptomyces sp. KS_5]SED41075.1 PAS domain-containing protein [Streptomyces sp. PAN_FS17]